MSFLGDGLFIFCAVVALVSAVGTIIVRSAIRAAMCLLAHIIALSGLFLTLHAHLLAALQVLVYAGAVVVLFVFVIMLLGPVASEQPTTRGLFLKAAAASLMGVIALAVMATVAGVSAERPIIPGCPPGQAECRQFGGVEGFSHALFVDGVAPFELIGVLLTVAIIGAIMVARGQSAKELAAAEKRKRELEAVAAAQRAREEQLTAEVAAHGGH